MTARLLLTTARLLLAAAILSAPIYAAPAGEELFDKKILPVLAARCYACHSSELKSPMGGLALNTKAGLQTEVIPGKPEESRLLQALRYKDSRLQMPPAGKLDDAVIADFERWIALGATDSRSNAAAPPQKTRSIEEGRKWWAFQPVREMPAPAVGDAQWPHTKIDSFILAKLEEKRLTPSPPAEARTLARRAYIDLLGLKPTYEQVEAFAHDSSPDAYERLIDRLLDSPHYGERWGRHWLDVARYGEDFGEPPFPYAWRYRDWVIEAVNRDVGYDRFVKLQLAADLMPGTARQDLRALGYLGTAPSYHKDPRLSQEVIFNFAMNDWDERVDAIGRGLLGMTVACARCHDHKFDPITQKDYYALAGVFASTSPGQRPLFDVDPATETRFMWIVDRLAELDQAVRYLVSLPGTNAEGSARRTADMQAEMTRLQAEMESLRGKYPLLGPQVARYGKNLPSKRVGGPNKAWGIANAPEAPFIDTVFDAALYVDGTDPELTRLDVRPGQARDLPVMLHGNVATPGETVPRHFLSVLSRTGDVFKHGSGRLELAEKIFTDAAPLTARVIVNRVWGWHFGEPLVQSQSDFGTQGDKPSHPELLDDLAARFIAHGWSLKWLNREIMISAAYRQSSRPRPEGVRADTANRLLWRMNPRRLDVEAYRDSLLQAAGSLNESLYGAPEDLDADGNTRRTVYGKVSRVNLNVLLRLYDFPDAIQTCPNREQTSTPLQQLFVMNSAFIQRQADAIATIVEKEPGEAARVRGLYRRILARDPDPEEIDLAASYLAHGTLAQYAQVLLSTNEEIYWP